MNGVQTRFKCKLDVKRCKRFVFPPSSLLPRSNALKTKAIRYFQTDRTLTRIVSPPLYLHQVCVNTKAMQWGTDQEENARELYERLTGRHIVETGSCKHPAIEHFASSPDGYYYDEETGEKGCLEIKCPIQSTFMKYKSEIHNNASLLDVKFEYFYQCMAHMMCTGAQWTDFVVYNPFQSNPIHIVRILPDEAVFAEMEKRIRVADDIVKELIDVE